MGTYFIEKIVNRRLVDHRGGCKDFDEARAKAFDLNKREGKESARRRPWHVISIPV